MGIYFGLKCNFKALLQFKVVKKHRLGQMSDLINDISVQSPAQTQFIPPF